MKTSLVTKYETDIEVAARIAADSSISQYISGSSSVPGAMPVYSTVDGDPAVSLSDGASLRHALHTLDVQKNIKQYWYDGFGSQIRENPGIVKFDTKFQVASFAGGGVFISQKQVFAYSRYDVLSVGGSTTFNTVFGYIGRPFGATHMLVRGHAVLGNRNGSGYGIDSVYSTIWINGVRLMYTAGSSNEGEVVSSESFEIVPIGGPYAHMSVDVLMVTGEVSVQVVGFLASF